MARGITELVETTDESVVRKFCEDLREMPHPGNCHCTIFLAHELVRGNLVVVELLFISSRHSPKAAKVLHVVIPALNRRVEIGHGLDRIPGYLV